MNKIDLHIHSDVSGDGNLSPNTIASMCKEKGLTFFALSDHNSIRGIKDIDTSNICVIPAIEFDVTYQEKPFHLLAYGIHTHLDEYVAIENDILKQEQAASTFLLDYTRNELNLHFDDADIERLGKNGVVHAEMIMEACMLQQVNYDKPVMQPYLPGGKRSDNPYVNFYWDYFSLGKAGYVSMNFPKMEDIIHFIHNQQAIAVLAHPGNNVKEDEHLLNDIISLGIDGIEVYSSYHSSEQVAFYKQKAKDHSLIITCGSDFHGKTKPSIAIGEHGMPIKEQEQLIKVLQEKNII